MWQTLAVTASCYFYPRPPRGGRPAAPPESSISSRFLSTPSARRATFFAVLKGHRKLISIHALREEGDLHIRRRNAGLADFYPRPPRGGRLDLRRAQVHPEAISIHALREEGDLDLSSFSTISIISIHALREEGDTRVYFIAQRPANFYPRPPRGGRHTTTS